MHIDTPRSRLSNDLETGSAYVRTPANFAYQLMFNCAAIILITYPLLHPSVFFRPLLTSLAYLAAALAPIGAQTSLFGLVTIPMKYMPYTYVLYDLLSGGPREAALAMGGIVSGHIWWWSIWGGNIAGSGGRFKKWGNAPLWLVAQVGGQASSNSGAREDRGPVRVMRPRTMLNPEGPSAGGSSTGHSWGGGQSLGTR